MKRRQFLQASGGVLAGCAATGLPGREAAEGRGPGAEFVAGVGVRSLVPDPRLVDNSLHSNMTVRFDERGSPLQVKALALTFGNTKKLLLAVDLVGVPDPHTRVLLREVAKATGLTPEDVVFAASHSHSTPFLEPVTGPHPFFDFVTKQAVEAGTDAVRSQKPAAVGHDVVHVAGASFNTRVPLPDGGVKFTRDFREGLASGRPVDPRLDILRFDDAKGKPMAGWVRFAAHPACVIFNAPLSAEYPGYLTDQLRELTDGSPPVLFGYGASGDVNCVPMFGKESDSRRLGHQLAGLAAPAFASLKTKPPRRFLAGHRAAEVPLDPPPPVEVLDREIAEVERFVAALEKDPGLEWVLGVNCGKGWSPDHKKRHVRPLAEWARRVKGLLARGHRFPATWPRQITAWVLDDLGLVFDSGETLVEVSLALAAKSPLKETLLMSLCNGSDPYLGNDADRRRAGYETYTSTRYALLAEGTRPLPYALGAADLYLGRILTLIEDLVKN